VTPRNRILQQIVIALVGGVALGCVLGALVIATIAVQPIVLAALPKSPTPTFTATLPPTITLAPSRTATLTGTPVPPTSTRLPTVPATSTLTGTVGTPAPAATRTAVAVRTPRPAVQHYMVGRPVVSNAQKITPSLIYLYGTTQKGDYDVHHGEEFENPTGTSLVAAADGTVVTAGSDEQPICGDDQNTVCGAMIYSGRGFYGKLVVIQLSQTYKGQRVFALYGHMNRIGVAVGDQVKAGDPIGEIGMSGIADGPHVHFEIRVGTNDYGHTRNPILWMNPLDGRGAIVGRYTDSKGNLIRGALVDVYRSDNSFMFETETYGRDRWPAVNSDDDMGENWAVPDLAAGDYVIRINGQPIAQRVTVQDGKLSFVELGGP
jgi:murein DD-endopeptidase MepM/ murein hydrolase activator NlpD